MALERQWLLAPNMNAVREAEETGQLDEHDGRLVGGLADVAPRTGLAPPLLLGAFHPGGWLAVRRKLWLLLATWLWR